MLNLSPAKLLKWKKVACGDWFSGINSYTVVHMYMIGFPVWLFGSFWSLSVVCGPLPTGCGLPPVKSRFWGRGYPLRSVSIRYGAVKRLGPWSVVPCPWLKGIRQPSCRLWCQVPGSWNLVVWCRAVRFGSWMKGRGESGMECWSIGVLRKKVPSRSQGVKMWHKSLMCRSS